MRRRDFIHKALGATGAGLILPVSLYPAEASPSRINLAAVGCGRQGRGKIRNFLGVSEANNARLVAVCDVDWKRALETREMVEEHYREQGINQKVKAVQDYRALLSDKNIHAVQIVTPDHAHAFLAIAFANAGKDIFLEKPLTYTIREGRELVEAVWRNKRVLQTGSHQRSSIYFRTVCQLARNEKLGKIHTVEVKIPTDHGYGPEETTPVPQELDYKAWLHDAPKEPYAECRVHPQEGYSRPGWMQIQDYCHGMITNWGAHMLDITQWGLGMEKSGPVRVDARAIYEERGQWDVHTVISGESIYANGVKVFLEGIPRGTDTRDQPSVKFIGDDGWAYCDRGSFSASDRELLRWRPGAGDISLKVSTHHYEDFLQSIRTREDPVAPVEVGHRSNTFCILYAISSRLKRPVQWDPGKEQFIDDPMANRMVEDMRMPS